MQPFVDEARDYPVEWASLPWPEAIQLGAAVPGTGKPTIVGVETGY